MTSAAPLFLPGLAESVSGAVTVEGTVKRVRPTKSDFRILEVEVERGSRAVIETWVGEVIPVAVGQRVRGTGRYETSREWGEQFRLDLLIGVAPSTRQGIIDYLGSGLIEGIGPVNAQAIVEHFGEAVLDILDTAPERVEEVNGIGPERAAAIIRGWRLSQATARVMIYLQGHGAPPLLASKIVRYYLDKGVDPMGVVQGDPYRLAIDIHGVGFATADGLARSIGVGADSAERAQAAALHLLGDIGRNGHTYIDLDELTGRTASLIARHTARAEIRKAIEELGIGGRLKVDPFDDEPEPTLFGPQRVRRCAVFEPRVYEAEWAVAARVGALLAGLGRRRGDLTAQLLAHAERACAAFETEAKVTLAEEQRGAVFAAATNPLIVVTGPPGSGKSTCTKAILAMCDAARLRVKMAAPTGRAAKRLSEVTGVEGASTIHRLLNMKPRRPPEYNLDHPLDTDVLLVDEVSMVDLSVARALLEAAADGTRVILVGDKDQLPSVQPGAFLRDLIGSGLVPVVRLDTIYRQGPGSTISRAAVEIMHGRVPRGDEDSGGEFFVLLRETPEAARETIESLVVERIPRRLGITPSQIAVMVPQHKGVAGTLSLNARLQEALNPRGRELRRGSHTFRVGDKVIQLRNDYEAEVFNGDLGIVDEVHRDAGEITVDFEGKLVRCDDEMMSNISLAYATTIHKNQGGEAPAAVVYLGTEHEHMLSRNLFYTAVTRGRRMVVVVASRRALVAAVREQRRDIRRTMLMKRLKAYASAA